MSDLTREELEKIKDLLKPHSEPEECMIHGLKFRTSFDGTAIIKIEKDWYTWFDEVQREEYNTVRLYKMGVPVLAIELESD